MPRRRFTEIKGLSEMTRLPRAGKIRLGIKTLSGKGQEHPSEVDYFVVPPEVAKVYGDRPVELDFIFPNSDRAQIFPQAYKAYKTDRNGNPSLICTGDGEEADRFDYQSKEWAPYSPCANTGCDWPAQRKCSQMANLMIRLWKVNHISCYQVDTGSINAMRQINSYLDALMSIHKRVHNLPLVLYREKQIITYNGIATPHYIVSIKLAENARETMSEIMQRRALPQLTASVDVEEPDFEDELVPASRMLPPPMEDEKLLEDIEKGFGILRGTTPAMNDAEIALLRKRFSGREDQLLSHIQNLVDERIGIDHEDTYNGYEDGDQENLGF